MPGAASNFALMPLHLLMLGACINTEYQHIYQQCWFLPTFGGPINYGEAAIVQVRGAGTDWVPQETLIWRRVTQNGL